MNDSYRHKGLRRQLVRQLADRGIADTAVLAAMMNVPRHFFLDPVFTRQAYTETAFQIGAGQTISHPYTVAFQTQLLHLKPGEKVLEIGTGSGFQTAVLCELKAKVYSIERQRELYLKAKQLINQLNYTPKLKYGDGYKGWAAFSPFDKIIITCGAPELPKALATQLNSGGKIVVPLGEGEEQEMHVFTKTPSGHFTQRTHGVFSFVPMLKEKTK